MVVVVIEVVVVVVVVVVCSSMCSPVSLSKPSPAGKKGFACSGNK